MEFARVIGNVVATRKEEKVRGRKFMVIQPLDVNFEPDGNVLVGVDAVGVGEGEIILYATGSSARQTHLTENRPTDCVIMAIVDLVEVEGDNVYNKSDEAQNGGSSHELPGEEEPEESGESDESQDEEEAEA